MRIAILCPCGVSFETSQGRLEDGRGKYCSRPCRYRYAQRRSGLTYQKHKENPTSFRPRHNRTPGGARHPMWKGDEVGYRQLHDWVRSLRPYPKRCEWCDEVAKTEWANVSHEYKRNLDDWAGLCRPCHRQHDAGDARGLATARFGALAVQEGR